MSTWEDPDALKSLLRAHRLHVTGARLAVFAALRDAAGHRSADEIYAAVLPRYPALNLVTIYRTLEVLEAHHLATRAEMGDHVTRWEWPAPAHHHVICRGCGAVVDLPPQPFHHLETELGQTYGVRVDVRHLTLQGLCAHCVSAAPAPEEDEPSSAEKD